MQTKKLVRVSSKGQIVLPKRLREKMGLSEGDYVAVEELPDGNLLLGKQEENPLDKIFSRMRQAAKEKNFTRKDLEEAIREVRGKKSPE
jgi:AbrB family looped-hinge helix DNA binding protein